MKSNRRTQAVIGCAAASTLAMAPAFTWAQALEIERPDLVTQEVSAQVEHLVEQTAQRDPELAELIKQQAEVCVRDITSDGKLDDANLTKEIETYREVQRELTTRVAGKEAETRIAELAKTNPEAAERLRTAFDAVRAGNGVGGVTGERGQEFRGGAPAGGETISREEAHRMFEQAYGEAQKHDPEGATRMKEMFEAAERGAFTRPTPEMMERMHSEMETWMKDNPDKADYARAEFSRMAEAGLDRGDRYGSTKTPEQAREAFEKWAADTGSTGRSQQEIEQARAQFERGLAEGHMPRGENFGGPEMAAHESGPHENAREAFERWTESPEARSVDRETMERYREMAERMGPEREAMEREYRERTNEATLENRAEMYGGSGGVAPGAIPHIEVSPGQWDGPDPDGLPDHTHPLGTAPHSS